MPQLAVIVDSLIEAAESVVFVALIMGLVFYMFAILAMQLFSTNDPFHFGYTQTVQIKKKERKKERKKEEKNRRSHRPCMNECFRPCFE